jgi:hypothetical protein
VRNADYVLSIDEIVIKYKGIWKIHNFDVSSEPRIDLRNCMLITMP